MVMLFFRFESGLEPGEIALVLTLAAIVMSKKRRKKTDKGKVTVGDVKKKIAQLALEKQAARESRDKKRIDILRRRISRMKKLSRKVKKA